VLTPVFTLSNDWFVFIAELLELLPLHAYSKKGITAQSMINNWRGFRAIKRKGNFELSIRGILFKLKIPRLILQAQDKKNNDIVYTLFNTKCL
jgi:hypothetical protein